MPWRMRQEPESLVLPAEVTGGGSRCSTACRVGDGEVSGPLRASSRGSKERGVHRLWQYRSLESLDRYIPKYFILSVAMVNEIVSLISLSVFSLLVYRNSRDLCVNSL